jgi:tetratricopeptide (TPR) repeat protein
MEQLQAALTLSREHGFVEEEAWCLLHLSVAHNHARDAAERDASIASLEQILKTNKGLRVEPSHLISAGNRALQSGDYRLAIQTYIEARGSAIGLGLHRTLGSIEANLGAALDHVGRYNEALEHYGAGASLHERFGDQQSLARVQNNRGMCLLRLGRHEESRQQLEGAERIQRHLGNRRSETLVQGNLAELDYVEGHIEAARQRLTMVLRHIPEMRLLFAEGTFLGLKAMLLLEEERHREARDTMTASIEILRRAGYPLLLARGLVRGATLALRLPEEDRAPLFLAEATEIADSMDLSKESELVQSIASLQERMTTI